MVQRVLASLLGVCMAASVVKAGQIPFIGEWKLDSSRSRTPDEMKVESKGGTRMCLILAEGRRRLWRMGRTRRG